MRLLRAGIVLVAAVAMAATVNTAGAVSTAGGRTASPTADRTPATRTPATRTPATRTPTARTSTTTRHFIANVRRYRKAPRRLGFNIFDTLPKKHEIDRLPKGVRALVWLGQTCPTRATARFRKQVRRLGRDPKVFGYFLSDEPHITDCPNGPQALATRTAFIRKRAPHQRSFIVLDQSLTDWTAGIRDYRSFRPAVTGVNLVGVDAYPCNLYGCDFSKIHTKSQWAKEYIPARKIVPIYQAFGQENTSNHYYSMPGPGEEYRILTAWAAEFPHPVMDYTYGWRHQSVANPTLVDSTAVQRVLRNWFRR